ncbi:cytochrome-c peroxidase [Mariniblastus fucicola]|uniref:Methylamine utilization protein MauG n=1 Tax=Mariniblastus fucicola TaxID=980251 RepID=A0A5B9PCZ7_9BACT|nr:cytochrome c peroxidase [Mariniblastus fucicola]QEG23045.1 Cytochrome c551 peroxidase precursor [Mariniblastus fucicola]
MKTPLPPVAAAFVLALGIATFLLSACGCDREAANPSSETTEDSGTTTTPAATDVDSNAGYNPAPMVEYVEVDMGPVLPPMKVPKDNPLTPEKIELGELLFFDTALSADNSMSCATCHDPELGWGNGEKIAEGASGVRGKRNVLSILNVGFYSKHLFWDGRVRTLEQQALVPVFESSEMGMTSEAELLGRLKENDDYQKRFAEAFGDGITAANVAKALASFQRTIYVKEIPYDRYLAGDKTAMSASAIRGSEIFRHRRVNCVACHPAPLFTDHLPYNIGIGMDQEEPDWGFHHTKGWAYWGKFRSPSLRGIDQTGPYMHDGSLATLEEVVEYYNKGGIEHEYTDAAMQNLNLSEQQKADLVTFLREGLREIRDDK